jgi:biofilm PGA synthesis N-glycosyltransferase PgaC
MFTTVTAVPKTLLKRRGQRARWISPDRGIQDEAENEVTKL